MKDKIYTESINKILQKLSTDIDDIKELSNNTPEWTKPHLITETSPKSKGVSVWKGIGVYRIIYKPTMEVMSIGCGNVGSRKNRHKSVFLNGGETIISKTLELWEMAASDGTIIMGPDYDKDNVKRQVDMFCRQRGYKLEKYLDTNYDNDLEPDHYMFAFQVTKSSWHF